MWSGFSKQYQLLDATGQKRKAWEIARGKRAMTRRDLWFPRLGKHLQLALVVLPVAHEDVPGTGYHLIVVRSCQWHEPWYLLTNEPIQTPEDAWPLVLAYMRRWQIEWSFR